MTTPVDRIWVLTEVAKLASQLTAIERAAGGHCTQLTVLRQAFAACHAGLVAEEVQQRLEQANLDLRAEVDADVKTAMLDAASDCQNPQRTC